MMPAYQTQGTNPAQVNYSYGYEEPQFYPSALTETQSSSVVEDLTRGTIGILRSKQSSQGRLKQKTNDVCLSFGFSNICSLFRSREAGAIGILASFTTQEGAFCKFLPAIAVNAKKYHKHLPEIRKFPAASYAELNEVISWKLDKCLNRTSLILYERQGFFQTTEGMIQFARPLAVQGLPPELVSESLQRRRQSPIDLFGAGYGHSAEFWRICSQDQALKMAGLCLTASLLLPFLGQEICQNLALVNFVSQDKQATDKLIALLSTNDLTRYTVPEVSMGAKALEAELNQVFDGVAVVVDRCFADEDSVVHEGTKAIIKASRTGRKLVATISDKIGYFANQLEEGCCISIPLKSNLDNVDVQTLRTISAGYEAALIQIILQNQQMIKQFIRNDVLTIFANGKMQAIPAPIVHTLAMLTAAVGVCSKFLHINIMTREELNQLVNDFCKSPDLNRTCDDIICGEFSHIVSEKLRSGAFSYIPKKNRMTVDTSSRQVILYGEHLYISQESMALILADMRTSQNRRGIINALRRSGILNATDGNTHPLDAYEPTGKPIRLYCYDFSTHIIENDVRELMQAPEAQHFFMMPEQLPDHDFLPLVSRSDGRIAGRQIRRCDAANNSFAIWGQSGFGKSYLMIQLMKRAAQLQYRVVVFDASDSFAEEVLYQELSKEFVDAHVCFYQVDEFEIPINLFRIDRTRRKPAQEAMLLGSICAGIPELSPQQKLLLRTAINHVLDVIDPDEPIHLKDICTMIDEDSPVYQGMMCKLEPLLYLIEQTGMAERTWSEFLTKDITVIRWDSAFTDHGNALFDMMMASLYNAQCEDPSVALDVFVDEIQCQNLSKGSAIHKLLTEGRKKGISFCGATQDYYPRNTEIGSTMGKADTQIFFKPTCNSTELVARELRFNKADCEKLDRLICGSCFIKGSLYNPEVGQNEPTIVSGIAKNL